MITKFHDAMRLYGGRLNHEHLEESGITLIEAYRTRAERLIASARRDHPRLPAIHFDYVNNNSLNAYAFKWGGDYFIGITWGAFTILRLLFMRMLADKNALLTIGDPNREGNNLLPLDKMITIGPSVQLPSTGRLVVGAPQDPTRLQFAVTAFETAFSFLIRHEITHILHGHLSHPLVASTEALLPEFGWQPKTASASSTRQVLEYDADRYASIGLAKSFMSHISTAQNNSIDHRAFMTETFVGIGSMFRLFGDASASGLDLGTLPYPPVRYRQYISMTGFCDYLNMAANKTLFELSQAVFTESFAAIENAFPNFTKVEPSIEGLNEVLSANGRRHIQWLFDEWQNRVKGELLPYSFAKFLS
ncbi:MAG: hypothetical protein OEW15_07565 [Nitrospirota bacterium]|nr:hypothetical protein [Nitrospirota bacterium]